MEKKINIEMLWESNNEFILEMIELQSKLMVFMENDIKELDYEDLIKLTSKYKNFTIKEKK